MSNIVIKTEYMVKEVTYSHINFAMLVSLALGKVEQRESLDLNEGNIQAVLPLLECADILGYKNNNPKTSKDNISALIKKGMKETVVTVSESSDGVERHMLITGYKTSLKRNEIIIFFNKDLLPHMYIKYKDDNAVTYSNRYISYNGDMLTNCNKLHTYYLYELFKLYSYKKGTYDLTFDELKKHLHIEHINVKASKGLRKIKNESYMDYTVFKKSVLSPAIKYINANTDLDVRIVKEDKCKDTYILNGKEKEVVSLKRIYFKISAKQNSPYDVNVVSQLASTTGKSVQEIESKIEKLIKDLEREGVIVTKTQIAVLMLKFKDETLIKCGLLDTRDKKNINNFVGYTYSAIEKIIDKEGTEEYKKAMLLKYSKKKNIISFELTADMKKDEKLVLIYDVYKINKGIVSKKDVSEMRKCLAKYSDAKIISAINICFDEAYKRGTIINSFKYIKTMLENGRFNGSGKEVKSVRDKGWDRFDELLEQVYPNNSDK